MDLAYDVSWSVPSDELNLRIGVEHAGLLIFEADLALTHATLKQGRATTLPIRYPLMPLLGLVAIYREALRLLLRHTSVYPHPASRQRQPR